MTSLSDWVPLSFFLMIAVVVTLTVGRVRRKAMAPFLDRSCTGRYWRRAFPTAPKNDIREFLQLFADAFAMSRKRQLLFRPDDRIMDVYRAQNPPKWTFADMMELETLEKLLNKQYAVSLESIWREDLTLGDVFARTRSHA